MEVFFVGPGRPPLLPCVRDGPEFMLEISKLKRVNDLLFNIDEMVLVTHPTQSSCAAFSLKTSSWSKGLVLKKNIVRLQTILRTDRCISLKHGFPLRPVHGCGNESKGRSLQISSFKGNIQNDKAGDASNRPVSPKSSVKISFLPQDREENPQESSTVQDTPVSCASESNKRISQSQTIRELFLKWLSLLQTRAAAEVGDDILESSQKIDHLPEGKVTSSKERGELLKVVLCYFVGLDATVTVPLLIFIPLYIAVNVKYGSQVSRELTPLWVIGPLIVALYVKLLRGIFALYVFSFKQSVKIMKNLPTYYSIACNYLAEGKLKEDINARFWQPIKSVKNLNYKELVMEKWKVVRDWLVERYLDFVESIWPHYCRTIRFLKRANLI